MTQQWRTSARRPRYQLCLTPCDTCQLTRAGATGCLSPRLTLPLGVSCCPQAPLLLRPRLGLSAGTSANSDTYLVALKASSLHFLLYPLLPPKGPLRSRPPRWLESHAFAHAAARACLSGGPHPHSLPELLPCVLKTQARCQPFQALPDHAPGPLPPTPRLHPEPSGVQLRLGAPTPPVASHRRPYAPLSQACPAPGQHTLTITRGL